MIVNYDALVQSEATEILLREMTRGYADNVSERDLVEGVQRMYEAVMRTPLDQPVDCYCSSIWPSDICDRCFDVMVGMDIGR